MSVCFIEVWPAEDDHVEDDDEAVKYREGRHLLISMRIELASCGLRYFPQVMDNNENEDGEELNENGDGDQPQERCFEVQGGPADDVEGHKVS